MTPASPNVDLPPASHRARAVFFDRDGTLIVEKHYLSDPEEVEVFPGAPLALKALQNAGYLLFIVTNQSGIGRGYYTTDDLERVHDRMLGEFSREGVSFQDVYFAPEAPSQPSRGRKPSPQFLFDARDTYGLDLAASYMIGDKRIDLECGWGAGVRRALLVRTGYGRELEAQAGNSLQDTVCVDDVSAAAGWILRPTGVMKSG